MKRRSSHQPPMVLNITSLMDALTIILFFLIMNFSSQEGEVEPPRGLAIPLSSSRRPVKVAVKVTIAANEVRVEDQVVVRMSSNGRFLIGDLDPQRLIKPLLRELQRQKAILRAGRVSALHQTGVGEEESEIVYLEAAKGTRYETIDRVLTTAAHVGFVKFRLAVQKKV